MNKGKVAEISLLGATIKKNKEFRFININPGFISEFGHHLMLNQILHKQVKQMGGEYLILGNVNIKSSFIKKFNVNPVFSYNSWDLLNDKVDPLVYVKKFKMELTNAVKDINKRGITKKNYFFMYLADLRHIPIIIQSVISSYNQNNYYFINLLLSYKDFFPDGSRKNQIKEDVLLILKKTRRLRGKLNVFLTVESEKLLNEIYKYTNEKLLLLPFFMNTFHDFSLPEILSFNQEKKKEMIVYYPAGSFNADRGLELVRDLILYTGKKGELSSFHFIVRCIKSETKFIKNIKTDIEQYTEIIDGVLSVDEYQKQFLKADVILIPYKKESFYARTSGIYSDAIFAQKPVLATEETWVGDKIKEFNNGLTFPEDNVNEFYKALLKIKKNFIQIKKNCRSAKTKWVEQNNINLFFNFIDGLKKMDHRENNPYYPLGLSEDEKDLSGIMNILKKNLLEKTLLLEKQKSRELREDIRQMEKDLDQLKQKMEMLISDKAKIRDRLKRYDQNLKNLREKDKSQSILLGNRDRAIVRLKAESANCTDRLGNRNQTIERLKDEILKKGEMIRNRDNSIQKLKDELQKYQMILKNRDLAIERLKKENQKKTEMIKNRDEGINKLKKRNEKQMVMIENRDKGIVNLKKQIKDSENK